VVRAAIEQWPSDPKVFAVELVMAPSNHTQARVRVMAEYQCFPIWRDEPTGVSNVAPAALGLSDRLASQLHLWAHRFDGTLNRADPDSSGFVDSASKDAFYADGLELARQMREELGHTVEVRFVDGRTGTTSLI